MLRRAATLVSEYARANELDHRYLEETGQIGVLSHSFADTDELQRFVDAADRSLAPLDISYFIYVDAAALARAAQLTALSGAAALERRALVALSVRDGNTLTTCLEWQREASEREQSLIVDATPAPAEQVRERAMGVAACPPKEVCSYLTSRASALLSRDTSALQVVFLTYRVSLESGDVEVVRDGATTIDGALAHSRAANVPDADVLVGSLRELASGADPERLFIVSTIEEQGIYASAAWHVLLK